MKRLLIIPFLLFVGVFPAIAGPKHVLLAIPKAIGRNYVDLVTFKHPWLTIQKLAIIGAVAFDETSTQQAWARCPACYEGDYLAPFKRRVGPGIAFVDGAVLATVETTVVDATARFDRPADHWLDRNIYTLEPMVFITAHSLAGASNTRIP